jgi:hypothetical protein
MSVEIDIEQASLDRAADLVLGGVLLSGTQAVKFATRKLEQDLEGATRRAVRGNLWRAWKSESYPKAGVGAYDPQGVVYVNGRARSEGAIAYWTQAGINRAKEGQWLAIPTDAAGVLNRQRNVTPQEWERSHGVKLRFVMEEQGQNARLVAQQVVFSSGAVSPVRRHDRGGARLNRDGSPAHMVDVTIFVLIPFQRFANKVSIEGLIRQAQGDLVNDFERRVRAKFRT